MHIENDFTVAAPVDVLWAYLLDVEKVAPCMPGAELTDIVDDHTWKGRVEMKFGPVAMSFAGTVVLDSRDDEAHRVSLTAKGMETKGKGAANATVTSWLEPVDDGATAVHMAADITLTGAAAQLSRGLLPEISKQLTGRFAECLESSMTAEQAATTAGAAGATAAARVATPVAAPVGGFSLGLSALRAIIARFFARLFGRGADRP